MILFDLDESACTVEWDEVCDIVSISMNETIRNAIKCDMMNSSWNIRSITSNDHTHNILIKWIGNGGHKGISIISVDLETSLNALRVELIKIYNAQTADELINNAVIPTME